MFAGTAALVVLRAGAKLDAVMADGEVEKGW